MPAKGKMEVTELELMALHVALYQLLDDEHMDKQMASAARRLALKGTRVAIDKGFQVSAYAPQPDSRPQPKRDEQLKPYSTPSTIRTRKGL